MFVFLVIGYISIFEYVVDIVDEVEISGFGMDERVILVEIFVGKDISEFVVFMVVGIEYVIDFVVINIDIISGNIGIGINVFGEFVYEGNVEVVNFVVIFVFGVEVGIIFVIIYYYCCELVSECLLYRR